MRRTILTSLALVALSAGCNESETGAEGNIAFTPDRCDVVGSGCSFDASMAAGGTMLVNILGSLMMGVVYVFILERAVWHPQLKGLIMVGLLGAFTTFSSFSLEAINFFERGHPWLSAAYVLGSVVLCIAAAAAGMTAARQLLG